MVPFLSLIFAVEPETELENLPETMQLSRTTVPSKRTETVSWVASSQTMVELVAVKLAIPESAFVSNNFFAETMVAFLISIALSPRL